MEKFIIWCSEAAMNFLPQVPYAFWACFFTTLFTLMNVRGIQASARTNQWVAVGLGIVIVLFVLAAIQYLMASPSHSTSFFTRPFYDPNTFSLQSVSTGTSLAVLTYIGFDDISTLSEEIKLDSNAEPGPVDFSLEKFWRSFCSFTACG